MSPTEPDKEGNHVDAHKSSRQASLPENGSSQETHNPVKVFVSCAKEDLELWNTLKSHLALLEQSNEITIWCDQDIPPGAKLEDEIDKQFEEASIILLLISVNFINSKNYQSKESSYEASESLYLFWSHYI